MAATNTHQGRKVERDLDLRPRAPYAWVLGVGGGRPFSLWVSGVSST